MSCIAILQLGVISLAELAYYSLGAWWVCVYVHLHIKAWPIAVLCALRGCLPQRKILQLAQPASAESGMHQFHFKRAGYVLAVFYCYGQLININSQGLSIIVWCLSKHRIISTAFGAAEVLGLIIAAPREHQEYIPAPHYSPAFFSNLHTG